MIVVIPIDHPKRVLVGCKSHHIQLKTPYGCWLKTCENLMVILSHGYLVVHPT